MKSKELDLFFPLSEKNNINLCSTSGLWGLVNNAGMLSIGPAEWVPLADFKKVADVNLWGVMDVTKTFLPLVKKAKGRVVFVGSVAGKHKPSEDEM